MRETGPVPGRANGFDIMLTSGDGRITRIKTETCVNSSRSPSAIEIWPLLLSPAYRPIGTGTRRETGYVELQGPDKAAWDCRGGGMTDLRPLMSNSPGPVGR